MNGTASPGDGPKGAGCGRGLNRHKQPQEFVMTESKKPQPASPDALAKTSPQGAVELSEAALADAAGGAPAYMRPTDSSLKLDSKINAGLLLPAVKPGL
jgi:hypothetical protein